MHRWVTTFLSATMLIAIGGTSVRSESQKATFEVASIKRNPTGRGTLMETPPTGRVNIVSATFKTLVSVAHRVQDYQIIGGPDWIAVDRFDIQARPPEDYHHRKAPLKFL